MNAKGIATYPPILRPLGKQRGFIQNLIIPGLILLGIVIGAIALMSSSTTGGTDKEQASINASQIILEGVTLKGAIDRAEADGTPAASIESSLTTTLVTPGYIVGTLPVAPAGSQSASTAWAFSASTYRVKDSQATPADLNTSSNDEVLQLTKLTNAVCVRINNKLYGETVVKANDAAIGTAITASAISGPTIATSSNAASYKVGTAEGCLPGVDGSTYTYYKVVKQN